MTYMYSMVFVLLSGSQANAIVFGSAVIMASSSPDAVPDSRLQKFFAIALVGAVCQLQAISRINYVRFSNLFAGYKIIFLCIVTVLGWAALGGWRTQYAIKHGGSYGAANLNNAFRATRSSLYGYAVAMLDIMRVYSGYENANLVRSPLQVCSLHR